MYEVIVQELIELNSENRFLGERKRCRYCGNDKQSAFGKKKDAHTFPEALGNKVLFSLDECRSCNSLFSLYEDALCKAIGPFITFGGVKGKKKVRQTGRSNGHDYVKHHDGRRISVKATGTFDDVFNIIPGTNKIKLKMPVQGDKFVPLYAYKALLKMVMSLLPEVELNEFNQVVNCLKKKEKKLVSEMNVGFSYAYVGNAPPTIAGIIMKRIEKDASIPYIIAILLFGSVCFQIWPHSDEKDNHVNGAFKPKIRWVSQLQLPEGGHMPIKYSEPLYFDWSSTDLELQPFEAFELIFDTITKEAILIPSLD